MVLDAARQKDLGHKITLRPLVVNCFATEMVGESLIKRYKYMWCRPIFQIRRKRFYRECQIIPNYMKGTHTDPTNDNCQNMNKDISIKLKYKPKDLQDDF